MPFVGPKQMFLSTVNGWCSAKKRPQRASGPAARDAAQISVTAWESSARSGCLAQLDRCYFEGKDGIFPFWVHSAARHVSVVPARAGDVLQPRPCQVMPCTLCAEQLAAPAGGVLC